MKRIVTATALGLTAIAVATMILARYVSFLRALQLVLGVPFVTFLPGFIWSWSVWSRNAMTTIERIVISFPLSLSLVALTFFLLSKTKVPFSTLVTTTALAAVCLIGSVAIFIQRSIQHRPENR